MKKAKSPVRGALAPLFPVVAVDTTNVTDRLAVNADSDGDVAVKVLNLDNCWVGECIPAALARRMAAHLLWAADRAETLKAEAAK